MIYTNEFFNDLPDDTIESCKILIEYFKNNKYDKYHSLYSYNFYLEAFAILEIFIKANEIFKTSIPIIEEIREESTNVDIINTFYEDIKNELKNIESENSYEEMKSMAITKFEGLFSYKFTDGDLKRIQELINELRDLITESQLFDFKHKQRLLNKLEKLQKELHKKMSSIDHFWSLLGDAGIAIGKFGNDAKPFVERIDEITRIIWRTQAQAEELPSGFSFPLLKKTNLDDK
ncbi:MAG: hypothetical protein HZB41_11295 [Ignavibacteriae bacterium]|nr:hypothetical protein [Ignavibacteriota bacterium]